MMIQWHCRSCNQTGEYEISIDELVKKRKHEDLLTLLSLFVKRTKHDTCKGDIGIKTK